MTIHFSAKRTVSKIPTSLCRVVSVAVIFLSTLMAALPLPRYSVNNSTPCTSSSACVTGHKELWSSEKESVRIQPFRQQNLDGQKIDWQNENLELNPLVHVFPFTQYGPNVQLLGFVQTLTICSVLGFICVEPGFSSLFLQRTYTASDIWSLSNVSVPFKPRNVTTAETLDLDYIIYPDKPGSGKVCEPSAGYWQMHKVRKTSATKLMRVTSARSNETEFHVLQTMKEAATTSGKQLTTIALIYCDIFAVPFITENLRATFNALRAEIRPIEALEGIATDVMKMNSLPLDGNYIAIHLRLRDFCTTSFEECCCTTSGSRFELSSELLDQILQTTLAATGASKVFIAAPPSFLGMNVSFHHTSSSAIVTWYSESQPGSLEESIVQQLICSKANLFLYSVEKSTWSQSVIAWQQRGVSRHLSEATSKADLRLLKFYTPQLKSGNLEPEPNMINTDQHASFRTSDSTCLMNETVFVMLREDGLGAALHFVLLAAGIANKLHYNLVALPIKAEKKWSWAKFCEDGTWDCTFKLLSDCRTFRTFEGSEPFEVVAKAVQGSWANGGRCIAPFCLSWDRRQHGFDLAPISPSFNISSPEELSSIHRGSILRHLLRANDRAMSVLRRKKLLSYERGVKEELSLEEFEKYAMSLAQRGGMVVGMHIRRGDSCHDPRKIRQCFSTNQYIQATATLRKHYNISAILLITDDPTALVEVLKSDLRVFTQNYNRTLLKVKDTSSYNSDNVPAKIRRISESDVADMLFSSIFDWFAFRKAHAFVGTFTSDFGRIAFELMSAELNAVPPYYSLEETFCKPIFAFANTPYISSRQVNTCF